MARPSPVKTEKPPIRLQIEALWAKGLEASKTALIKPWRTFQRLCFSIGVGVLVLVGGSTIYVVWFLNSLPDIAHSTNDQLQDIGKERVRARLENKKARYRWTELRSISRELIYSIVISEDATFFEHEGFNFESILSSLAENLKEGKHVYGASTISQQVSKNLYLSNEKTYIRKIREFLITKRLERYLTKNEILEIYLNIAEFGPDIYGVDAAARHYFSRSPADLNAAEGAFLALMLPSPKRNYYSIFQNHNLTKQKQRRIERVLRDMLYEEYLSEAQYRQYVRYRYFPDKSPRMPARAVSER